MSFMFYGCSSLGSLPDISNWNIDDVSDMDSLFLYPIWVKCFMNAHH